VRLPFLYLTLASSRLPLRVRAERRAPEGQKRAEVAIADLQACVWQNRLNYPGSSAQTITIKATLAQTHFKRNNSGSVG